MKNYKFLPTITGFFVASLYLSNILDVKLWHIGMFVLPAGMITFPITFLFGDVLTEVYGYSASRRTIWTGFVSLLFLVLMLALVMYLPAAPFWNLQKEYEIVLGRVPRIVAASIIAYFCSEFTNSFVLAKLKVKTEGKGMPVRFVLSTVAGQAVDTTIFCTIAFLGTVPLIQLPVIMLTGWIFKSVWEVVALPVSIPFVKWLKKKENEDYYDKNTNFSPFVIE